MHGMKILFVVYDNASQTNDFPLGVAYLAAALRKRGYDDVTIFSQDIYHYPDEYLTEYLDKNRFDVVGLGVIGGYYQYRKMKNLAAAINRSRNRPVFVIGGQGPSPEPKFFMEKTGADFCVVGEGEEPIVRLIDEIAGSRNWAAVPSLYYRDGNEIKMTARAPAIKDVDSIPFPAWDLFPVDAYACYKPSGAVGAVRTMPVLTCRGCLYRCNFCYRMEKGIRLRSFDAIIEEMTRLVKDHNINFVRLRDELLFVHEKRIVGFCEALKNSGLKIQFDCNGRLNMAKPYILKMLKECGCVYVNYGIESLDQNVLDKMDKIQTVQEAYDGIKATVEAGINVGFNLLWNNIGDSEDSLRKAVDFLKRYNTYSEIRTIKPVTPYPGSPLYYHAIEKGLLEGPEDFYEHKHLNSDRLAVNFMEMSDERAYELLFEANQELLKDHYDHLCSEAVEAHRRLYFENDTSFRGLRH
jgi:radical SAM superfamily enzyme YgiQ (UPF0313 family)